MATKRLSTVARILCYQLLVGTAVSLGFVVWGEQKSLSSALGGLAAIIPNLYFALRVSSAKVEEPKKILRSFYTGESVKLLLTAALFTMIFQIPHIQFLPLLAGYASTLSVFWFALLMR